MKGWIALAWVGLLMLLSSCAAAASAPLEPWEGATPIPAATLQPEPEPTIVIDGIRIVYQREISFAGHSSLLEGACIRTQLFVNDVALAWWPAEVCVSVHEGAWEIAVPLGEGAAPTNLDAEADYLLRAWADAYPDSDPAVFWFDLRGPRSGP